MISALSSTVVGGHKRCTQETCGLTCRNVASHELHVLLQTSDCCCFGVSLVEESDQIPCSGRYGDRSRFLKCHVGDKDLYRMGTVVSLCVISTAAAKKRVQNFKCPFLTHESASVVCVCGNSQRAEMSRRNEWNFRTFRALFQDFAVPVRAPAPALVPSDTSHRPALLLWEEQSPCGSWRTGRGIRNCHMAFGWSSPAGRSLLRNNLRGTGGLGWAAPAGSVPPWRRC